MPYLNEKENEYVSKYLNQKVKLTRKGEHISFQENEPAVGTITAWHWYDGVVLHLSPDVSVYTVNAAKDIMVFEWDELELIA